MRASLLFIGVLTATGCIGELPTTNVPQTDVDASVAPTPDAPPPPADATALLKTWSGCMSLANFQTATMATSWGNMSSSSNQRCTDCHQLGGQGFMASLDEAVYFQVLTTQKYQLLKYFSVDVAAAKVIINTASFKNAGVTLADHPHFNPDVNAGMTALKQFYDLTVARKAANQCDPSRLVD
jgi:hypothetical protein